MHLVLASVSAATSPSGVCRHAANIARGMTAHAAVRKVTLLTGEWQAGYFREAFGLNHEKLEIVGVSIANRSLERNRWYLRTLPRLASELCGDVVHLAFPVPAMRSAYAMPVVASVHDLYAFDISRNFGWKRAWLNRAAMRMCVANTDVFACVSDATRSRLHELFPKLDPAKTSVIPNSIYLSPGDGARALPESLEGVQFLLCVAQHRANKNLPVLLRWFRAALNGRVLQPEAKLVVVGNEGPETRLMQRVVADGGLGDRVLFLRGVSDPVLSALYANCELVVAASLIEGFGLPVAEALSAGCRVVCSDIVAFRAADDLNCTFFDPRDESGESFLAALRRVLKGPHGPVISSICLDPQRAAAMYLALYSELLQQKKIELTQRFQAGMFGVR